MCGFLGNALPARMLAIGLPFAKVWLLLQTTYCLHVEAIKKIPTPHSLRRGDTYLLLTKNFYMS